MKKSIYLLLFCLLGFIFFLSSCGTSKCECEYSNDYKKRKSKVSLINSQKNSNFAVQKDKNYFLA